MKFKIERAELYRYDNKYYIRYNKIEYELINSTNFEEAENEAREWLIKNFKNGDKIHIG